LRDISWEIEEASANAGLLYFYFSAQAGLKFLGVLDGGF
jgi:hypothetical protein